MRDPLSCLVVFFFSPRNCILRLMKLINVVTLKGNYNTKRKQNYSQKAHVVFDICQRNICFDPALVCFNVPSPK